MQEYLNVLKNHYADFKGRARRREYWMFVLFNMVASVILAVIDGALGLRMMGDGGTADMLSSSSSTLGILSTLYSLGVLIPGLAVTVRRLHDTGRSGWWVLVVLIPLLGAIALFVFTLSDSQAGSNKWGPNPKGQGEGLPQNAAANW